ncbi:MAG: AAA family ATPase [Chlamydiota bacterium]
MLKSLSIKNLSLIEDAEVKFGPHFNVITGETGAGKSSFMRALAFALGERAESSYIRTGCSKASIVALFEKEGIEVLLEELGIDHEGSKVIIKREISSSGQSRAFINNQPVLVNTLEKVAAELINLASQQAHFELLQKETPQRLLDTFADLDLHSYQELFQELVQKKKEREIFKKKLNQKETLLKELYASQKLLEQAHLLDEEAALFAEYSRVESQKERLELFDKLHTSLFSSDKNFLSLTQRFLQPCENIPEIHTSLKNIYAEVSDLSYNLEKYLSNRGPSSEELEKDLKTIDRIKLLWSADKEECLVALQNIEKEIHLLKNFDQNMQDLEHEITDLENKVQLEAAKLTSLRLKASLSLEKAITREIASLHMAGAIFHINLTPTPLSVHGAESVEFMLTANVGERKTPLKGYVSGGELSRIMLALQTVLAGPRPVLLFDEADAGIGGMTAVAVAQKLKQIAEKYQVICVTHLPQMAEVAAHHFLIEKFSEEGRTYSRVTALKDKERSQEIMRMKGTA